MIKGRNFKSQSTIEFVVSFLIVIMLFLLFIDTALYWKDVYSVETVANQIMARAELADTDSSPDLDAKCQAVANVASDALEVNSAILPAWGIKFGGLNNTGNLYYIANEPGQNVGGSPRIAMSFNCKDAADDKYELTVAFRHFGILLFTRGVNIVSSANSSTIKY